MLAPAHVIAVALTFYGLFMLGVGLLRSEPVALSLFTATFVPVGAVFAILFTRKPERQVRWGHPFIFVVAVLAAGRDVLEISIDESLDTRRLTLLTLGAAAVMLDRRWFGGVAALVSVSWGAALLLVPGSGEVLELSLNLFSAIVVGLVMNLALTSVHRRREEAIARTQVILDAIGAVGEGYLLTDGRRILDVNDAYLSLAKRTREEALALEDILQWAPVEDRGHWRARLQHRLSGEGVPDCYEARLIRGDGTIIDVEASVKPISTSPRLIFSIVRDISERKAIERQARSAQAMRDKVTAGLSHDLRSPLTAVLGFSEILRGSWGDLDPTRRAFILEQVAANARELEEMIDELLDFSRLEHGWSEIVPQRVPFGRWLDDWAGAKAPSLRNHRLRIEVGDDVCLDADPRALARIVGNLVGNATKFAPAGSRITIGARVTPRGSEFWVEDEGPGVPAGILPRIFDPFAQAPTEASARGVGMGLAVVSRYVELHGGEISVHSEAGRGARFLVRLPRRRDVTPLQLASVRSTEMDAASANGHRPS